MLSDCNDLYAPLSDMTGRAGEHDYRLDMMNSCLSEVQ